MWRRKRRRRMWRRKSRGRRRRRRPGKVTDVYFPRLLHFKGGSPSGRQDTKAECRRSFSLSVGTSVSPTSAERVRTSVFISPPVTYPGLTTVMSIQLIGYFFLLLCLTFSECLCASLVLVRASVLYLMVSIFRRSRRHD